MIYGPKMAFSGTRVHINCIQLEGRPHDLYITTPQGTVIPDSTATFNATSDHTGNFTCTANTSKITITESHYLFVYGKFFTIPKLIIFVILCDTHELIFLYMP